MNINEGLAKMGTIGAKVRNVGIFLVILGALSVWAPQVSGKTLAVIIGILLIFGGIGRTTFSWIAPSWGSALLRAAAGVLTVIAGIYILMQPRQHECHDKTTPTLRFAMFHRLTQIRERVSATSKVGTSRTLPLGNARHRSTNRHWIHFLG